MYKLALLIVVLLTSMAYAHEHKTGETSEEARVVEFYRTWTRPKGQFSIQHRLGSCCYANGDSQDCFPVLAARKDEHGVLWVTPDVTGTATLAQSRYGGQWYALTTGVEEDRQPDPRESPDGRSHVCIAGNNIICYVGGWGQ